MLSNQMQSCIDSYTKWAKARAEVKFGNDSPQSRILKRRFGINEAAEMIGVTRQAIAKAEDEGRLPKPDLKESNATRTIRAGYTLAQIDFMRDYFQKQPYQVMETSSIVISVPGGKGGCWKTSTAVHLSQWLSLAGYRVLFVDIDPQAHGSMYFGYHPELNTTVEDTILPFMLGNKDDLTYCVKETAWPKLNIIPSNLQLQRIESELDSADIEYPAHQMLQAGIQTIRDHYDVIIIDGHPDLGMGTTNMICASDAVLIATSAEINDMNSTCQLMGLIRDIYAPNGLSTTHEPHVRVLPTKLGAEHSSSQANLKDMQKFWNGMPLDSGVFFTDEVGKGQRKMATIYEQAEDRGTPAAWKRATDIYDATFSEILNTIVKPMWGAE
ncbi:AAA family ATPase [Vibrio scophthalmi]|uniref:AAA family ATPase n=1 Tax=Vibrio scophthalmi TaxID=45658 RepID=UPI002283C23B|nr:AAA family ATPase [Vibrio scophthalmi]MCY9805510.1 AAA family ATPase [Vibrio scophthalmi]